MKKINLVSAYQAAGDQPVAIETLIDGINNKEKHQTLLGVTGSGKTMIYLDIVAKYLSENSGQILVCLPEIALTPQTQEFFRSKLNFSPKIWHSGITKAKKRDTALDILSGKERLIIGTRSAILLPFKDLLNFAKEFFCGIAAKLNKEKTKTKITYITLIIVLKLLPPKVPSSRVYIISDHYFSTIKV